MLAANPLLAATDSPPIPEAKAWLARYAGGRGAPIDLSQAVPGTPPPDVLLQRLGEAAATPEAARYGPILGDDALRAAYAEDVSAHYRATLDAADVAITAGCNQAFFVTVVALARAGEAILLPAPWYFNHKMTCDMLGIEARPLACDPETFLPDPAAAERAIDDRVRAILLVTPNNPTGAVYPPALIEAFAALARRRGVRLVLDETYRDFRADDAPPHGLLARPDWRDTVVQLYSFSKAYGVPGHRIGAIAADPALLAEIAKVLDCVQISAPRVGQMALAGAIGATAPWRAANRAALAERIAATRAAFQAIAGFELKSIGAYFAFVRHPFEGVAAATVAEKLAVERGVLALPGPYFGPGQERNLRIAFANVEADRLAELPSRLRDFAV